MSNKLKPWQGLVIYVLVFLTLITAGAYLQARLSVVGLILSELVLVLVAVGFTGIFSCSIKDAIPITLPPIKSFFGGAMLYAGTLAAITPVTLLLQTLFPQEFGKVSSGIGSILTSVSPAVGIIAFALIPAICEEIIMRGIILSSMKSVRSKLLVSAIVGVMFGILHLDPIRFFPTAMLGAVFAYIALETDSIILPAIFHFLNNSFSVVSSYNAGSAGQAADSARAIQVTFGIPTVIGLSLFYGAIAIPLFYFGTRLLKNKKPRARGVIISVVLAVVMIISGLVTVAVSSVKPIYSDFTEEAMIVDGHAERVCEFTVEEDGLYSISVTSVCDGGLTAYKLKDEKGNILKEVPYDSAVTDSVNMELEKGRYILTIYAEEENEDSDAALTAGVIVVQISVNIS